MRLVLVLLVLFSSFSIVLGQESNRAIDLAAEEVGVTLCDELDASDIAGLSIAFLPLFCGDGCDASGQVYSVIRAELASKKTRFSLFTRDEKVWDTLVGEIDFGAKRRLLQ